MADQKVNFEVRVDTLGTESISSLARRLDEVANTLGGELGEQARTAAARLRELAQQDAAIENFLRLKTGANAAAVAFRTAQREADNFAKQIGQAGPPTAAEAESLRRLQAAADNARAAMQRQEQGVAAAQAVLQRYGISSAEAQAAQARLRQEIDSVRGSVQGLVPAYEGAAAGAAAAGSKIVTTHRQIGEGVDSISKQLGELRNLYQGWLALSAGATGVGEIAKLADEWNNLRSRLQLALGAQADINKAMAEVEAVAKGTYTSLDATAELYGKIVTAGKDMGVSQQQALGLTRAINESIQLSGAGAQASDAAVRQLIQALQSGVLRGDEFNSVMEQAPRLAKALADGLNVPIGSLRAMAEAGKLTSEEVIRALQNQSAAIGKEFSSLPVTIGRAVQNLQTEWLKFVGTMDSSSGASATIASGIESVARHLDDLARIAAATGAAMTASFAVQAVQALRAAAAEMAATGGAAALLRRDLDKLSQPVKIAIAVTGFEVGWQIGEMLRENSALARQFGVGVVGFFTLLINDLRLLKEAATAVFTSDTVDAALKRYVERNKEIGARLKDMFADAEAGPAKLGAATDAATNKLQAMGPAAQVAGAAVATGAAAGAAGVGQVADAAERARDALERVAKLVNQKQPPDNGIANIVRDLAAAKARGEDVDQLLREQMPQAISKLSGPELVKFRAEFVRAMDEAGFKGKEVRTGLLLIGEQAAQSLGVDVPLSFNKFSEQFVSARANLAVLIRELPALKAAGVDTAAAVSQAIGKMIDSARSKAELEAVRAQIEALRKQLGDKITDGLLEQVKKRAEELVITLEKTKPGINDVSEAWRRLGIMSDKSLKEQAASTKEAYDYLVAKGTSSTRELSAAWRKAAEDAIAANNGIAPSWVAAQAAARGYELQVDAAGKATVRAAGEGAAAVNKLDGVWQQTQEGLRLHQEAMDRILMQYKLTREYTESQIALLEKDIALQERRDALERKRLNVDKNGYELDKAGNTTVAGGDLTTLTGIAAFLKSAGVADDNTARNIARQFADGQGNIPFADNPGQRAYGGASISQALLRAAERYTFGPGSSSGAARTPSTIPEQTRTVNINWNGEPIGPVRTDAAGDAVLEKLMEKLREAKGSSI